MFKYQYYLHWDGYVTLFLEQFVMKGPKILT